MNDVKVKEDTNAVKTNSIPIEQDGCLKLSSLSSLYPGVTGLKYYIENRLRLVKLSDGKLIAPEGGWADRIYICVFPTDKKRKCENSIEQDNKTAKWACSDLVVLGLSWQTTNEGLTDYFSKFGELQFAQVKSDASTKRSKGYGFIRFLENESQVRVMLQRHQIDGRWCEVRLPSSKDTATKKATSKLFIGQCSEDMTENDIKKYFSKFGEVVDAFIPQPFRGFGFVKFSNTQSAEDALQQHHHINGKKVIVTEAIPKQNSSSNTYNSRRSDNYKRIDSKQLSSSQTYRSPTPDKDINADIIAKVVNKAVLGVIGNIKSAPSKSVEISDSVYWSRR